MVAVTKALLAGLEAPCNMMMKTMHLMSSRTLRHRLLRPLTQLRRRVTGATMILVATVAVLPALRRAMRQHVAMALR
jgi:hypothetical protein